MKILLQFRICCFAVVFILLSLCAEAAQYYVVIGTFARETNAQGYANMMRALYKAAKYEYNAERKLYYVHVLKTSWKEEARNLSLYLKYEKGFNDVWVFTDVAAEESPIMQEANTDEHGESRTADANVMTNNGTRLILSQVTGQTATTVNADAMAPNALNASWTSAAGLSYMRDIRNIEKLKSGSSLASGKLFKFIVENSAGKVMSSEVKLMDFEKLKKIAAFTTDEYVAIRGTKPNQVLTIVCEVLGYTIETRMLNIDHLSRAKGVRLNEEGVWEVRFKLKKMEMNDVSFLHKTIFYKDAAVLEPSSKKEMDELLSWMKTNPGYKIVIHSHCNPGVRREITLPAETNNYFDLKKSSMKTGSDKMLTKARAETLRGYLVDHGIDKKRIDVMGWGAIDMLTSSTAKDADINERIEVELVSK